MCAFCRYVRCCRRTLTPPCSVAYVSDLNQKNQSTSHKRGGTARCESIAVQQLFSRGPHDHNCSMTPRGIMMRRDFEKDMSEWVRNVVPAIKRLRSLPQVWRVIGRHAPRPVCVCVTLVPILCRRIDPGCPYKTDFCCGPGSALCTCTGCKS